MEIRFLSREERVKIESLYLASFDDKKEYVNYYVRHFYDNVETVAAIDGGEIIAMANVHYKRFNVDKEETLSGYIYGVATLKCYQGKGVMKQLLLYLIEALTTKGIELIYLIPSVSPDVYKSSGFYLARNEKIYNFYYKEKGVNAYTLEKNYLCTEQMYSHLKDLIELVNDGYVEYTIFPIMVYDNEFSRRNFAQMKERNVEIIDMNICDIVDINSIYDGFLNNEYV